MHFIKTTPCIVPKPFYQARPGCGGVEENRKGSSMQHVTTQVKGQDLCFELGV